MKRRPKIKYGILDDFGEVVRWVWEKPTNRKYVIKRLPSDYELAMIGAEDAPF